MYVDLGSRIKEMRERRSLTQKALANKVNKSVAAISSYETNAQTPPTDVLVSIASALNVSLDFLVGFDKELSYSLKNLNDEQKELVDLIFEELTSPSNDESDMFSKRQELILKKMLLLFGIKKAKK